MEFWTGYHIGKSMGGRGKAPPPSPSPSVVDWDKMPVPFRISHLEDELDAGICLLAILLGSAGICLWVATCWDVGTLTTISASVLCALCILMSIWGFQLVKNHVSTINSLKEEMKANE